MYTCPYIDYKIMHDQLKLIVCTKYSKLMKHCLQKPITLNMFPLRKTETQQCKICNQTMGLIIYGSL